MNIFLRVLSLVIFAFSLQLAKAQQKEAFDDIMNTNFTKDYKGKVIETDVIYFDSGNGGYRVPNKLKMGYTVFRCYDPTSKPKKNAMGAELGDFVFIKKDKKDLIKGLKQGDKITLIGEAYLNNNMGYKQSNFIATDIKKKEE